MLAILLLEEKRGASGAYWLILKLAWDGFTVQLISNVFGAEMQPKGGRCIDRHLTDNF
jgi:hypothetical protein